MVFDVFRSLMLAREIEFEEGRIILFRQRISMIPTYTFASVQKELEKIGKTDLIYRNMKELGIRWTHALQEKYGTKRFDVLKWGKNVVTLAGWGIVDILIENAENKSIKFRLRDSAVADLMLKEYGKSKEPVDHIFRGMVAGTMSVLYETDCDTVELMCKAMGHPYCEFIVKERSRFDLKNKIVAKQIK